MSTAATRRAADHDARVFAMLTDIHAMVVQVQVRLDALERRLPARGPRLCDVALVLALADSIGADDFTTRDVFEHVRLKEDEGLAAALRAADVDNARGLGWWCRRMAGEPCDGFAIVRCGDGREGGVWQVVRLS